MTIECIGLPKSGKSTFVRTAPPHVQVVPENVGWGYRLRFFLRHPIVVVQYLGALLIECARTRTWHLFRFKLAVFLNTCGRVAYAKRIKGVALLDEGFLQRILSLYERPMPEEHLRAWVRRLPISNRVVSLSGDPDDLRGAGPRRDAGEAYLRQWREALAHNQAALVRLANEAGATVVTCTLTKGAPVCDTDPFKKPLPRTLVVTQAIDLDDPVLGFFHGWVERLSSKFTLTVICLYKGRYELPGVRVFSLGKEKGRSSRLRYVLRFLRLSWRMRHSYDSVFVHMNEEYVLLASLWWRLAGKRVVLWRNHKSGSWKTRLAGRLADQVCYTSPQAYVAGFGNAVRMPVGIDTQVFVPAEIPPSPTSVLFFGRLDAIKRPREFVLGVSGLETKVAADLVGSPTDPNSNYARDIMSLAEPLIAKGVLTMHPGVSHAQAPGLYREHAIYVNLTQSGSFDKTIGEAMASGCLVIAANEAVRDVLPPALLTDGSPEDVTRALQAALTMSREEREEVTKRLRTYIEREHSLELLMNRLEDILTV